MTRRRLTTTLLVSLFVLNSLGLTLWVHLHGHDHDAQPHQSNTCVLCLILTSAGQDKGVIETPWFRIDNFLITCCLFESPSITSHPAITSLYRRGPPLCT